MSGELPVRFPSSLPSPIRADGTAPTDLDLLADRSLDLLEREPTRDRWSRPVPAGVRVWVRADDVVVIGDDLVELADGISHNGAPERLGALGAWSAIRELPVGRRRSRSRLGPVRGRRSAAGTYRSRLVDRLLAVHTGDEDTGVVDATDTCTGEVAWRHRAHGPADQAMWFDWLATAEVGVLPLDDRPHPEQPVRFVDPTTGQDRWTAPAALHQWSTAGTSPSGEPASVDLTPTGSTSQSQSADGDGIVVVHQDDTVAGADPTAGAIRWKTSLDRYASLLDVQATGEHVVAVSLGRDGDYKGWASLSVRNRSDGRHRWNRWWSAEAGVQAVVAVCDNAVVILEGSFLRARALEDGELLWAMPVEAISGMTSDRHPDPRGLPWLNVIEANPLQPWVWLQRSGVGSAFVHGRSGRVVPAAGAIHLSRTGLVLTRTDHAVTCLALPAELTP